jgi:hypothetical protein
MKAKTNLYCVNFNVAKEITRVEISRRNYRGKKIRKAKK